MSMLFSSVKRKVWRPWLSLALLGAVAYLIHALNLARYTTSFLDEGLYTYKGFLFATGRYQFFQQYGLWTNQMPLSFLIPGYVQKWFGPGLAVARYFMIFLALLTLIGLWVLANRWAGKWWAVAVIWAMALNPAEVKILTLGISQGLIACMLTWVLVLTVGLRRPLWQTMLGGALAGSLILTRINLAFVLPLLLVYIFWQHGKKAGLLASFTGLAVVAIGHALFWPDILSLWTQWIPQSLTPFLDPWRWNAQPGLSTGEVIYSGEVSNFFTRFLYFWMTIRLHFLALFGVMTTLLLWPWRRRKSITGRMRAIIFLLVLFGIMFVAHMGVAFFKEYCVSCILLYVVYFDFIGLLILAMSWRLLVKNLSIRRLIVIIAFLAVTILCVGFSAYNDISAEFVKNTLDQLRENYIWAAMQNVTHIPPQPLFRWSVSILASSLVLLTFLAALKIIWNKIPFSRNGRQIGIIAINILLVAGLILSPTPVLGQGNNFFSCGNYNVLESYQAVGEQLREVIPPGAKIYWSGRIPAIFLYLPDVVVYPPQLNNIHNYRQGGDPDLLLRYGRWNDILAHQWIKEADFILLQAGEASKWELDLMKTDKYTKILSTRKAERCRWQSVIEVYQPVRP
jgi:hypothetical protein